MKSTSLRRALLPGIAALALALSACGSSDSSGTDPAGGGSLSGTLNGGGSSAQESAQGVWRAGFQGANDGVTVNYDPVGSGTGRENFISKAYAFAGSDSYLSDDDSAGPSELAAAKQTCGSDAIEVPAYVSPIAVVYNLQGVDSLNLSADVVSQIFDEKITTWSDPAIAELNPDATLPDTTITPVHRVDDSGTTQNFTEYLSAAGSWSYEPDGLWPKKGGEAADGTSGLVAAVGSGDGAIGYADESQAGDLGIANIQVGSDFTAPSAEGAAKVVAVSPRVKGRADVDMAIDVDRTTTEAGAYPIILVSYLIACQTYSDAGQADLVKGLLAYVVSDAGQQASADQAGSAPLDADVATEAAKIVGAIKAG